MDSNKRRIIFFKYLKGYDERLDYSVTHRKEELEPMRSYRIMNAQTVSAVQQLDNSSLY